MSRAFIVGLFGALFLVAAACGSDSGGDVVGGLPRTILGEEFILGPGAAILVDAGSETLRVDFLSVESDSRCPAGVQCVTAGDAKIFLGLTLADGLQRAFPVTVPPGGRIGNELQGYKLTLIRLLPDPPPEGAQIGIYRATLSLTRTS